VSPNEASSDPACPWNSVVSRTAAEPSAIVSGASPGDAQGIAHAAAARPVYTGTRLGSTYRLRAMECCVREGVSVCGGPACSEQT